MPRIQQGSQVVQRVHILWAQAERMSKRSFRSLRVFLSKVSRTEVVVGLGKVRRPTRKHLKHVERAAIVARTGVGNAEEVVHVGLGRMCLTVIFQLSDSFLDVTRVEFPMRAT